jgi:hypothetical protein
MIVHRLLAQRHNPNESEPFEDRLGRCYELAGRFATSNADCTLVYGSIQGNGKPRLDHAWVELPGGDCWEPITNKVWPAIVMERLFGTIPHKKYSNEEVLKNSLKYEHWGPWD